MRESFRNLALSLALPCIAAQAQMSALHASGTNIVNISGTTVTLMGVNLGGWFIMESFNDGLTDLLYQSDLV